MIRHDPPRRLDLDTARRLTYLCPRPGRRASLARLTAEEVNPISLGIDSET